MGTRRPTHRNVVRKRLPSPMGSPDSSDEVTIWGLKRGSFRSSATKSNTASGGRSIRMSPRMRAIGNLSSNHASRRERQLALRRRGAGVAAAAVEAEGWVLVSHERRVGEHPVAPAVEAHRHVEELRGVAPRY